MILGADGMDHGRGSSVSDFVGSRLSPSPADMLIFQIFPSIDEKFNHAEV